MEVLINDLKENKGISCVLFLWWDWDKESLIDMLYAVQSQWLKTALYSWRNLEEIETELTLHLNYIKVGKWDMEKGPLQNPNTNQKMYNLDTKQEIIFY